VGFDRLIFNDREKSVWTVLRRARITLRVFV